MKYRIAQDSETINIRNENNKNKNYITRLKYI